MISASEFDFLSLYSLSFFRQAADGGAGGRQGVRTGRREEGASGRGRRGYCRLQALRVPGRGPAAGALALYADPGGQGEGAAPHPARRVALRAGAAAGARPVRAGSCATQQEDQYA